MANDILVLPANDDGKDKWIGDVHGGLSAFKDFLKSLKKDTRGFCVGDLTDRGEDSLGVIEAIIKHNKEVDAGANKGKFYSIYGNHEDNMVSAITMLEKMIPDHHDKSIEFIANKNGKLRSIKSENNGGQWLFDLFQKELDGKLITIDEETKKVIYDDNSKIKMIKECMSHLPYIIHVSGNRPVVGVHADMPISDMELQRKIKTGNLSLTAEEREYAIWARKTGDVAFKNVGRNENSMLAFVGHNIVRGNTHCFRAETNTIDLDVASFYYGLILGVTIPTGKAKAYGQLFADIKDYPEKFYTAEAEHIEGVLFLQKKLFNFIAETKECKTMDEVDVVIARHLTILDKLHEEHANPFNRENLLDFAMRNVGLSDELIKNVCQHAKDFERLILTGFDRQYIFDDKSTLIDHIKNNAELSRIYIQSELADAINNNHLEAAESALKRGANLFYTDSYGNTPLDYVGKKNDDALFDLLNINSEITSRENEILTLQDKFATPGWSLLHLIALVNDENEYHVNMQSFELDPKAPASIPAENLDRMILTVSRHDGHENLKAATSALKQFYEKHETDEQGYVTVTPEDIRNIRNNIAVKLAPLHQSSLFNRPVTTSPDVAPSHTISLGSKKSE